MEVQTRDHRPIAHGFWDAASPIAVRILESGGPGHRFADAHELVAERLSAALDRRLARLDLARTNAFRWVHGEADLLPGIHVDFYADTAVVRFDGEGARAFYEPIEARLRAAAGGRLEVREVIDRGERASGTPDERRVLEDGATFIVDLANAQKGGLFLDQRENRLRVAAMAQGKSVLNLFGYTGGFSVHAALAGATRTDTVDVAAPAVEAARRNFEANGLSLEHAGFHARDAFEFLTEAAKTGERWDIVISDPPSFAPRKDTVPAARNAYERLHRLAAAVVDARRPALRRVLLQPLRAGSLSCQRRGGCAPGRPSLAPRIAARRRLRPPRARGLPGGGLPQVRHRPCRLGEPGSLAVGIDAVSVHSARV